MSYTSSQPAPDSFESWQKEPTPAINLDAMSYLLSMVKQGHQQPTLLGDWSKILEPQQQQQDGATKTQHVLELLEGSVQPAKEELAGSPDHFKHFVHSPQAHSSPRSPISARDYSPELDREWSPEVNEDFDKTLIEDAQIAVSRHSSPAGSPISDHEPPSDVEADWSSFLIPSIGMKGRIQEPCADTPVAVKEDKVDEMTFDATAQTFFDQQTHGGLLLPEPTPTISVDHVMQKDSLTIPTVNIFSGNNLSMAPLLGALNRSSSFSSLSSDDSLSMHSSLGLYSVPSPSSTSDHVNSVVNDAMMSNGCRTVFQMIVDGHAPELVDDFVTRLHSVTGQMVPTRIIMAAQEERKRRLWSSSNASVSSFSSQQSDLGNASPAGHHATTHSRSVSPVAHSTVLTPETQRIVSVQPHQQRAAHSAAAGGSVLKKSSSTTASTRRGPYGKRNGKFSVRGTKRFSCDVCHKQFDRAFNLKTHRATHDDVREKPYLCPVGGCHKDFARKHDCQRHFKTIHVKKGEAPLSMIEDIVQVQEDEDVDFEQDDEENADEDERSFD